MLAKLAPIWFRSLAIALLTGSLAISQPAAGLNAAEAGSSSRRTRQSADASAEKPEADSTPNDEPEASPLESDPSNGGATETGAKHNLKSSRLSGDVSRVDIELEVGGTLSVTGPKQVQKLPLSVVAKLAYDEKLVTEQAGDAPLRSVRAYQTAEAVIKVEKSGRKPTLAEDRRLMVVELTKGPAQMFSPAGMLTRDELDLVQVVGNSLAVERLLPNEEKAIGDSWKHDRDTIAALLGIDAVAQCEVESVLVDVADGLAKMTLAGTVQGAAEGVATEIEVKAKYNFHLEQSRITGFNMAVREKRSIGHVSPGLEVVAKLKMRIAPEQPCPALADEVLATIKTEATPEVTRLKFESVAGFRLACESRWYVTSDSPKLAVLRLVDRGDLIAQCNISPVVSRKAEKATTLAEYQNDVQQSLGKNFGEFLRASQWKDERGQMYFRVVVQGQVEKLPIEWHYYLLSNPEGHRLAAVVTVEGTLVERLGELDKDLVTSLEVLQRTAAKPKETATK